MAEQYSEVISQERAILSTLQSLIDSRIVCKMGIARTKQSWMTLLLEIQYTGNRYHLLIDRVTGFENVLSRIPEKEISLEFSDTVGVPCWFYTQVIACHQDILAEFPKTIYRIQRRQYFRVEAFLGTEITFLVGSAQERKTATVKNYSAGGVAFFLDRDMKVSVGDSLSDMRLNIPEGKKLIDFQIPKAEIRRIEEPRYGEKALCAIEFTEIDPKTRNNILSHVFRQQMVTIQRIRTKR